MNDNSTSQRAGENGWRIFTVVAGLVGWFWGGYAAGQLSLAVGLHDYLRDSGAVAWNEIVSLGFLACIIVISARPRNWRQFGLLLALVVFSAFWFELAEDVALLAQHAIARQGSLFIMLSTFTILALPVLAPVWLTLERTGMLEPNDDDDAWRVGVGATVSIIMPGLLAATLLIDLLRAFAWLPADPGMAIGWTVPQIAFTAIMAGIHARPAGTRQWAILGGTLAAAMIAAVMMGAAIGAWAGPLDEPRLIVIPLGLASWGAAFFMGWTARRIAHRLAERHSPWQSHGPGFGDTP